MNNKLSIHHNQFTRVSVAIHYFHMRNGHGKMLGDKREHAGVCQIALGFFAHGNFKMVLGFLPGCRAGGFYPFLARAGGYFDVNVLQFISRLKYNGPE